MPTTTTPRPRIPRWALLSLPPVLRGYVVGAPLVTVLAIGYGLAQTPPHARDWLTFAVLVAGGGLAVESRRRLGEPAGVKMQDLLSTWWLPIMVLLPPVYMLLAPIPLLALSQWRIRWVPPHRRVFSAAVISLPYAGVSVAFHALAGPAGRHLRAGRPVDWLLFAAGGLLAAAVNALLVSIAIRAADPQVGWKDLVWNGERAWLEIVELSAGSVVTLAAIVSPALVLAVLPVVIMLQRSFMHTQLTAAARLDGKTGLLNAVTWERESEAELARLQRTRQPAAVLLVDIDHFKAVNDTHGHAVGDQVLVAVAGALSQGLREGDLLGRFGGDEFAVLLPTADQGEARQAAERLRDRVAALSITAPDATPVGVTISVGAAVSHPLGADLGVADLLVAADTGLYQAKTAGRNHIRLCEGGVR